MPLLWKFAPEVLGAGNAAYKPSNLDQTAQPKPNQIQASIPEVIIDETGKYEIRFGEGRRFSNGTVQLNHKNEWFSAHPLQGENALKLLLIEKSDGSDPLGVFKSTLMKWELENTSESIHTIIKSYPDQPIVKFKIVFPNGLKDVSTQDFKIPFFRFPCFSLEGPNKRVLAYRDIVFSPPTNHIPKRGTQGPIVFYDNELNAAAFGPMEHFMIAYTKKTEAIYHGFEGEIQNIPEAYEHSSLLFFTKGVNKAVVEWCALLYKYYNTTPRDPYADPVVANIGFWTDNGAYYYYRKEKGMNYASTIEYASKIFKELGIPFKYYQLDSWWYQKDMKTFWKIPPFSWLGRLIGGGAFGGTIVWEEISEEFPEGLEALHQKINVPFACHARWFSTKSPYIDKYKTALGETASLPIEVQFWDDLMKQSAEKGIILYEQDWLITTFKRIPFLREEVNAAEDWLTWMAEAAHKNQMTIQYCMAPSGAFLYAIKLPAITNARVTGDYHARATKQFFYPQFSQTNIFAWGVGIWPSLDSYLTTTTPLYKGLYREKYPVQMTLLSNLGGGVICPADRANRVDKELLMKTCTEEGLLLKPDRPITVNDLMFKINQKPYIMDTWSQRGALFWRYIFIVNLWPRRVKDHNVTLRELGYPEKGVLYDFKTEAITEIGPDDKIDVTLKNMEYTYLIFAPFLKEGLTLIGSPDKFVTCANKLIPNVQMESKNLVFFVQYSPNSSLRLLIYSTVAPQDVKAKNDSVSLNWEYNSSTKTLHITLNFTTSATTEITILFKA